MKNHQLAYLSVKIKSLAAEAKIIRRDERRYRARARAPVSLPALEARRAAARAAFAGLQHHRRTVVRGEARVALLAQGYLRGTSYRAMESVCYAQPDWSRVLTLIRKYGGAEHARTSADTLEAWRDETATARLAA